MEKANQYELTLISKTYRNSIWSKFLKGVKEYQLIKEGDKVITILTRDKGVIRSFVNGANNIKSPKTTATGLITYSQFDVYLNSKESIV